MSETLDKRAQLMGTERVPAVILRLAGPAIASMVVVALYNMADTYFVSVAQDGDLGVAAVSVFMPIMLIMQSVAILFAAGGAAYLSRLLGEGDMETAGKTASITIAIAFLSGVAMMIAGLLTQRPVLYAFGASDATIDMAMDYATVLFIAAPIQLANMAFNNLLRAEGNAVCSMAGMVTGAVLNIVLDPIFISVLGMGVMGAAIATVISQCVAFVILGQNYLRKKTVVPLRFKQMWPQWNIVRYILKIGVSTFLIQIFSAISFGVMNICIKVYGDVAIAAVGIVNKLQFIGFAVIFGFAQGFQPVAGYNFGAGKFDRLKKASIFGILVAITIGLGLSLLFRVFATSIIGAFTSDANVMKLGVETLQWFTIALPVTAFSLIILMTYQALGKAVGATMLAICRQGVCLIPTALVLANILGWQGILIAPLVSDLISGAIAVVLAIRIFGFIRSVQTERIEGRGEIIA